jgi:hypothetical protein
MRESRELAVNSETFEYKIPRLLFWLYTTTMTLFLLHEIYEVHREVFVSV